LDKYFTKQLDLKKPHYLKKTLIGMYFVNSTVFCCHQRPKVKKFKIIEVE